MQNLSSEVSPPSLKPLYLHSLSLSTFSLMWRLVRASAATAAVTAAVASSVMSEVAYADGRFFFPSRAPAAPPAGPAANVPGSHSSDQSGSSTASSGGFDPESLERGAKALREINKSPHAKQVFVLMPK